MKTNLFALVLLLGLFISSCDNDDDDQPTPTLNQTDINYLNQYTQANLAQLSLGQLAMDSGSNSGFSPYTQATLSQYRTAQLSLDSIAQQYNLTLPTTADTASITFRNTLLSTPRGRSFDSLYLSNQLTALDNYLIYLNNGTTQIADSWLKRYIDQQRPLIQQQRINTDSLLLRL